MDAAGGITFEISVYSTLAPGQPIPATTTGESTGVGAEVAVSVSPALLTISVGISHRMKLAILRLKLLLPSSSQTVDFPWHSITRWLHANRLQPSRLDFQPHHAALGLHVCVLHLTHRRDTVFPPALPSRRAVRAPICAKPSWQPDRGGTPGDWECRNLGAGRRERGLWEGSCEYSNRRWAGRLRRLGWMSNLPMDGLARSESYWIYSFALDARKTFYSVDSTYLMY